MLKLPKLLIIGHARHGKDTVCEIITKHWLFKFKSSSEFCAEQVVFNALRHKYNYATPAECYEDRHNHRAEWFNAIKEYCAVDNARLGRELFAEYDIYCGLRNAAEFHAMRNTGIFDYAIWVDRSNVQPLEDASSMNLQPWMADFVIDNNGTAENLTSNTIDLITHLLGKFN